MTKQRDKRAALLLRAGLEIIEDFDGDEGPQPWGTWPSYLLEAGWFTVAIPAEMPGLSAELDDHWRFWARQRQLFDASGTFLIDILTEAEGGVSGRWTRVRLMDRCDLAGVLGARPVRPDFVALSTDGATLIRMSSTEDEIRLRILDRIGERRQAATHAATVREAPNERAEVWERLFRGADPSPRLRKEWANGLALNPSTPMEELARLLGLSHHAAYRAVPRSVVEAAMAHPDSVVREVLTEGAALLTPEQWSRMILGERDERRRFILTLNAARQRTRLTGTAYSGLATDPSARIREAAAELTGLPVRLLTALTADSHSGVRRSACLAAWPHLDWRARHDLLADPDSGVRTRVLLRHHEDHPMPRAVFEDGDLGLKALSTCRLERAFAEDLVVGDDPARRRALAGNPWLEPDLVHVLSRDPDHSVRCTVAVRADLSEEQRGAIDFVFDHDQHTSTLGWVVELHDNPQAMRRLAVSPHPLVRRSVARARRLPPDVVELLSRDEDRVVQLFLAESCDDAPGDMLLRVWTWWTGSLTHPGRPRSHPRFPRRGLLRFAGDPDPRMRQLALDDPESTTDLVDRFSQDDDGAVRRRAATDLRLEPRSAVRLLDDPDSSVRRQAAGHPSLPAEALVSALLNPDTADSAAENPALPTPVVMRMIHWLAGSSRR